MLKILSSVVLLLSVLNSMQARERTGQEMRDIALRQLASAGLTRAAANDLTVVMTETGYDVYAAPGAFVVVSRDENVQPVLGYSLTSFDASALPCGLRWWLSATDRSLKAGHSLRPLTRAGAYGAVEPFLPTRWDQGKPYNYKCPKRGNTYMPTGCVATAMAQVMKYAAYPESGKGRGEATFGSRTLTTTLGGKYDWASMRNTYERTESAQSEQVVAVSTLMRDAGYAVHMDYHEDGSAAYMDNAAYAMVYNFRYDSLAVRFLMRSFYTDDEWLPLLYGELQQRRPVLYSGSGEQEAHAFVLCGMDDEGRVYVNWGWSGYCDGYYALNGLAPEGQANAYNDGQSMIIGMRPQETPDASDQVQSQWLTSDTIRYSVAGPDTLRMRIEDMYNYSLLEFRGEIGVLIESTEQADDSRFLPFYDSATDTIPSYEPYSGYNFAEDSVFRAEADIFKFGGMQTLAPGTYRLHVVTRDYRETGSQPMRTIGGVLYGWLTKRADGTLVVADDFADTPSTAVRPVFAAADDGDDRVQVFSPDGRLLYVSPRRSFSIDKVPARRGLLLIKDRTGIRKVVFTSNGQFAKTSP